MIKEKEPSIVVSLPNTTFSATDKSSGNIAVLVTDLLGNPISNVKVFLMKATSFADDSVVYSNQQLNSVSNKEFSFNFFTGKPSQGYYFLDIGVQVGGDTIKQTTRTIKVVTSVSVASVSIDVLDSADKEVTQSHK